MISKIRKYVITSYLVFWVMVLGICGTASMVFHCSPFVMRTLSNICAWSPTLVLLLGFRYWCKGQSLKEFFRKAFSGKIKLGWLSGTAAVTIMATVITVMITGAVQHRDFSFYWQLGNWSFLASLIFSITTGPTGEEAGWRGFLRPLINEKYGYIKSCVVQGVIWAFWHTVLWFVDSDFGGLQLIPYIISNVVVMTGLCFMMNLVMNRYNNLFYGIVIHFCFNFLYCFLKVDILFYVILSVVYIFIIAGCIAADRCMTLKKKDKLYKKDI